MAYPELVLFGAGDLKISHAWWNAAYEFPHPTTIDLTFRPERHDGGAVMKTVVEWSGAGNRTSRMINRQDGWRPILTVSWGKLSTAATNRLRAFISVCNLSPRPLRIQPHDDVDIWFDMLYDATSEVDFGSPGGMYLGHAPTVRFIGIELINDIPSAMGSGTALADAIYEMIL